MINCQLLLAFEMKRDESEADIKQIKMAASFFVLRGSDNGFKSKKNRKKIKYKFHVIFF